MIINQINIQGLTALKPKNYPPITRNGYGVKTGPIAFKLMELQGGKVHIFHGEGRGQQGQDVSQPFDQGLFHTLGAVFIIEGG